MKKFVIVLALAAVIATGTAFADHPKGFGIGLVGFYPGGGGLSLKLPSVPIYWAVSAEIGSDYFSINLTGDSYLIDDNLSGPLHWFLGLGGFFSFYSYSKKYFDVSYGWTNLAFGARLPIGLSFQPISLLEIFLDVAPCIGLGIYGKQEYTYNNTKYVADEGGMGLFWGWPIELGIRLWF